MRILSLAFSTLAGLAIFTLSFQAFTDDDYPFVEIPYTQDFATLAAHSEREGRAILLMFSGDHCRFCTTVEENFLKPMLRSGDYDGLISMHKVHLSGSQRLVDFNGQAITASELAQRYGVFVMPTVVFLDPQGNEVAPKRVGLMTEAYYGGYLDESIRTAAAAVAAHNAQLSGL